MGMGFASLRASNIDVPELDSTPLTMFMRALGEMLTNTLPGDASPPGVDFEDLARKKSGCNIL